MGEERYRHSMLGFDWKNLESYNLYYTKDPKIVKARPISRGTHELFDGHIDGRVLFFYFFLF